MMRVTFDKAIGSGPGSFVLNFGREDPSYIYFDGQIMAEYEQGNRREHGHTRKFVTGYQVFYKNHPNKAHDAEDSVMIDFYGEGGQYDAPSALRECKRLVTKRLLGN